MGAATRAVGAGHICDGAACVDDELEAAAGSAQAQHCIEVPVHPGASEIYEGVVGGAASMGALQVLPGPDRRACQPAQKSGVLACLATHPTSRTEPSTGSAAARSRRLPRLTNPCPACKGMTTPSERLELLCTYSAPNRRSPLILSVCSEARTAPHPCSRASSNAYKKNSGRIIWSFASEKKDRGNNGP